MTLLNHRAEGPSSAPPLLLGPSLGTSYALWDEVAPELSISHRVVRWDLPGILLPGQAGSVRFKAKVR